MRKGALKGAILLWLVFCAFLTNTQANENPHLIADIEIENPPVNNAVRVSSLLHPGDKIQIQFFVPSFADALTLGYELTFDTLNGDFKRLFDPPSGSDFTGAALFATTDLNRVTSLLLFKPQVPPGGFIGTITLTARSGIPDGTILVLSKASISDDSINETAMDVSRASIKFTGAPQPPVANDDRVTVQMNGRVNISILGNDIDFDPESLIVTEIIPGPNTSLATMNTDKTLHYRPKEGFVGTDELSYIIKSNFGADTARVVITIVLPPPTIQVLRDSLEAGVTGIDFGLVEADSTETRNLLLLNQGGSRLDVAVIASGPSFGVSHDTVSIAPGDTAVIGVRFAPNAPGQIIGFMELKTNDPNRPQVRIALVGVGAEIPGRILLDLNPTKDNQALDSLETIPGDTVKIQIFASELPAIQGYGLNARFDPGILDFSHFEPGEFISEPTSLSSIDGGLVEIGASSLTGRTNSGAGHLGDLIFLASNRLQTTNVSVVRLGYLLTGGSIREKDLQVSVRITIVEPPIPGDFDGDREVGFRDFLMFSAAFMGADLRFDLDKDGAIGFSDFVIFAQHFGVKG